MIVKQHLTRNSRLLLAVCDTNLKGKKIEDDKICLDLSSEFYDGKEMTEKEILPLLKQANIINLVGKNSVEMGIKAKIIDENSILKIKGIPHAQGFVRGQD